jgi:hypothetical protein
LFYKAAQDTKYDVTKLRYVLNGKRINKVVAKHIEMKCANSFIIVKNRRSEERGIYKLIKSKTAANSKV